MKHLNECNNNFKPALEHRVNISEYSKKIFGNAVTFEAWSNKRMIGMIAVYFNPSDKSAFITNVSVIKEFMGKGIAKELLRNCLVYSSENMYTEIKLEVNKENHSAIELYRSLNFIQIETLENSIFMNYLLIKSK